ncbi:lysine-sensitive aspartokinase 3 [Halobacteriovorax sp. XZX-3]|uniref:lysine-sensitive aspartokinase 3 n=1 Tax=unclassified Halobacteriovorax TaxID=2639665 RepID=UPI000CD264B2|nr:lysine-sensitive aspartokinase 3 [Halobacteriovorax sp. DA5]POB14426.1 lysine-sensitive aspartokinase 3 [Halobacteriovorax sp. DA5]
MSTQTNEVIVAKFGGSSMANLEAMTRSAQISVNKGANMVVVSAVYGVTNLLVEISKKAPAGDEERVNELIHEIEDKHRQILQEMQASESLKDDVTVLLSEVTMIAKGMLLLRECSDRAYDSLVSLGERLSSLVFSEVLARINEQLASNKKVELFDIRQVLVTDDNFTKAAPDIEATKARADQFLVNAKYGDIVYVSQGFIGATSDGLTTTLGRGGSDYSAALVAEAMGADTLQIWTDVAGIATTDPRIVKEAKLLNEITFSEAAELATFGAKILHPTTLTPALRAGIKVFVGSSYEPNEPGTWIKNDTESAPLIRAMALRREQSLVTLSTPKMLQAHGFLFEIFKIFNEFKVSIDSITTSEISVALTLDDSALLNKKIIDRLSELCSVKVEKDLTLVSLIGNEINHTPNLAARIFNAVEGINVRMICLGASKHNFCFLVGKNDADQTIQRLHKEFI